MNSPSNNSHPFPPFENNSGSGQQRRRVIIIVIIMRPTLSFFNFNLEEFDFVANMERRSYRTVMKPRLPRKVTAGARINLNRFWNELEEFYDRRTKNNNMPDYTTDTYDHAREEAENRANERLEEEEEEEEADERESSSERSICW